MNINEKIAKISEILDKDISAMDINTSLSDIPEWDSLAVLSYSIMMEDNFGKKTSIEEVRLLKTIKDILDSME